LKPAGFENHLPDKPVWESEMEIKFADGTRIEVAESAMDDFLRHDLRWVEFVHGRASEKQLPQRKSLPKSAISVPGNANRCPAC
jgi:hypothetical protein